MPISCDLVPVFEYKRYRMKHIIKACPCLDAQDEHIQKLNFADSRGCRQALASEGRPACRS